jgi:secreted PhoX family phosphatase
MPGNLYGWARFHERFDLGKEPNEPNRFGWVVESVHRVPGDEAVDVVEALVVTLEHDVAAVARHRARRGWARFHERFDLGKEPNEPNRFGWVVEIDPFDPTSSS